MGCTGFKNVIHKFCALHTPLKQRILAKFSFKNKQALPINIVIITALWTWYESTTILLLNRNWTFSSLISSFLENKDKTSSNLVFIYMHLISTSCVVVLVIESIFHVVFLTASQFWHHLLNKVFWQNKMLFRPTIPSFFSLKPETHFFGHIRLGAHAILLVLSRGGSKSVFAFKLTRIGKCHFTLWRVIWITL